MEKILWCEVYSVAVEEIEEQHKNVIGMINKLLLYDTRRLSILGRPPGLSAF